MSDESMKEVMAVFEEGFIFRKLGLCFDYISQPGDFPRKTLPNAKDARNGQPTSSGLGSGIACSTYNGGLLFDGYLLRIELGLDSAEEERILDRLIGGLIRTATSAPKGYLVRGLTPDGRGFYGQTDIDSHVLWAFGAWRCVRTAAISPESQDKIRNIASKWIARLEKDEFAIPPLSGETLPENDLKEPSWERGPKLLALLAAAAEMTGDEKWSKRALELAEADEGQRLLAALPAASARPRALLTTQIALTILRDSLCTESLKERVTNRMRDLAGLAVSGLNAYTNLQDSILEETPDLDWRGVEVTDPTADFPYPTTWRRLAHEAETVGASLDAALTLLLTGDKALCETHGPAIADMLANAPWRKLWLASAMSAALSIHGRGVELGLWDAALLSRFHLEGNPESLVARFLEADYDELNPEKAGHTQSPKRKPEPEPQEKSNRSRNRNRNRNNKTNKQQQPSGNAEGEKKKGGKRSGNRRRRRRRPRANKE